MIRENLTADEADDILASSMSEKAIDRSLARDMVADAAKEPGRKVPVQRCGVWYTVVKLGSDNYTVTVQ